MKASDVSIIFRPIDKWPRPLRTSRKSSQFKTDYNGSIRLLKYELASIGADHAILQLSLGENAIRQDGQIRGDAGQPKHPGVILCFKHPKTGDVKFPCDTYTEWRKNVHALALSLEALRAVDRYGVTQSAEQYRGWAQLPPPGGLVTPAPLTLEQAARVVIKATADATMVGQISDAAKLIIHDANLYRQVKRDAMKRLHPDGPTGGDTDAWNALQAAAEMLKKHHGL